MLGSGGRGIRERTIVWIRLLKEQLKIGIFVVLKH